MGLQQLQTVCCLLLDAVGGVKHRSNISKAELAAFSVAYSIHVSLV